MDAIKIRELRSILHNFKECCDCSNTVMRGCYYDKRI